MDLDIRTYETFEDLSRYCYCVAGTVGLCCVHVFGFSDRKALDLAPKLGIAFQLTNILRDIAEDYSMGRIYLPQEDLKRFGCSSQDLSRAVASPAFVQLMRFEAERAWGLYDEGAPVVAVDRSRQPGSSLDVDENLQRNSRKNRIDSLRRACSASSRLVRTGKSLDYAARRRRPLEIRIVPPPHVIVIGGGLAGLSAATALADAGCRISLFERSPRLGGRATSYILQGDEHIDNCQHVTLRCCTNLEDFYFRIGVLPKIAYNETLFFADSTGVAPKCGRLLFPHHSICPPHSLNFRCWAGATNWESQAR